MAEEERCPPDASYPSKGTPTRRGMCHGATPRGQSIGFPSTSKSHQINLTSGSTSASPPPHLSPRGSNLPPGLAPLLLLLLFLSFLICPEQETYVAVKVAMAGRRWSRSGGFLAMLVLMASALAEKQTVPLGAGGRRVPPLFVFGDSTVDVGNNNFLPRSWAKANFPPHGIDFPGGKPTGRFSNGYNVADYIAKQYGFKQSPPAFLSLTASRLKSSICKGINFASGGAGILNDTGSSNYGEVIPMDAQLDNFRSSLKSFTARRCSKARRALLSKSVFLVDIGSSDVFMLYNSNTTAQTNRTISKLITALASKYRRQLRTLYRLGARRFAIVGLGKLGCCPALRRLVASGECIAALDDYAFQFNVALKKVLEEFSSKHEGIKYSFGDVHNFGKMLEANPLAYGFKEIKVACCGGGRFNGEAACTPNATLCSNRDDYYFWDWYHLSDSAAKLLARLLYRGPPALASPINFGELAEDKI